MPRDLALAARRLALHFSVSQCLSKNKRKTAGKAIADSGLPGVLGEPCVNLPRSDAVCHPFAEIFADFFQARQDVLLVSVVCLAVGFNVIREDIEPNACIPQILRHLDAHAAFIPSLA